MTALTVASFVAISTPTGRFFYLLVVAMLASAVARGTATVTLRPNAAWIAAGLYGLMNLASYGWSSEFEQTSPGRGVFALVMLISLFVAATVRPREPIVWPSLERMLSLACLLASLAAFVTIAVWLAAGLSPRLEGFGPTRNAVVAGVVFGALFVIAIANRAAIARAHGWPILFCEIAVLVGALALTQSRGPILACGASIAALLLLEERLRIGAVALLAAALCMVALLIWQAGVFEDASLLARADSYRLVIWEGTLAAIRERWLFGHGVGTEVVLATAPGDTEFLTAHSIYLGTLFDVGLAGFVPFVALCAICLARGYNDRARADMRVATALLVFGLACGLFDFDSFFTEFDVEWLVFWMPVAWLARPMRWAQPGEAR